MRKVDTDGDYDFYFQAACGDKPALYNIVPARSEAPTTGYENMLYIEKVKGVSFPHHYRYPLKVRDGY